MADRIIKGAKLFSKHTGIPVQTVYNRHSQGRDPYQLIDGKIETWASSADNYGAHRAEFEEEHFLSAEAQNRRIARAKAGAAKAERDRRSGRFTAVSGVTNLK